MSQEERKRPRISRGREKSAGDHAGAVIGNIIALVAINLYPLWRPLTAGVVTEGWTRILWAADLSLLAQIGGNLILLFWRPRWLRYLFELVFSAAGLLSVAVFFAVFPLDFSRVVGDWLNTLTRVILILGMLGTAIGVVVNLVRLLAFSWREE
jgi:hypothetical protein